MTETAEPAILWHVASLVNLTPHALDVYGDEGQYITSLPASGTVARVADSDDPGHKLMRANDTGILMPMRMLVTGECENVPAPQPGTSTLAEDWMPPPPVGYIVSRVTAEAMSRAGMLEGRQDIFIQRDSISTILKSQTDMYSAGTFSVKNTSLFDL